MNLPRTSPSMYAWITVLLAVFISTGPISTTAHEDEHHFAFKLPVQKETENVTFRRVEVVGYTFGGKGSDYTLSWREDGQSQTLSGHLTPYLPRVIFLQDNTDDTAHSQTLDLVPVRIKTDAHTNVVVQVTEDGVVPAKYSFILFPEQSLGDGTYLIWAKQVSRSLSVTTFRDEEIQVHIVEGNRSKSYSIGELEKYSLDTLLFQTSEASEIRISTTGGKVSVITDLVGYEKQNRQAMQVHNKMHVGFETFAFPWFNGIKKTRAFVSHADIKNCDRNIESQGYFPNDDVFTEKLMWRNSGCYFEMSRYRGVQRILVEGDTKKPFYILLTYITEDDNVLGYIPYHTKYQSSRYTWARTQGFGKGAGMFLAIGGWSRAMRDISVNGVKVDLDIEEESRDHIYRDHDFEGDFLLVENTIGEKFVCVVVEYNNAKSSSSRVPIRVSALIPTSFEEISTEGQKERVLSHSPLAEFSVESQKVLDEKRDECTLKTKCKVICRRWDNSIDYGCDLCPDGFWGALCDKACPEDCPTDCISEKGTCQKVEAALKDDVVHKATTVAVTGGAILSVLFGGTACYAATKRRSTGSDKAQEANTTDSNEDAEDNV